MVINLKSFIIFCILCFIPSTLSAKTVIRVGYLPILDHLTLLVSHAQDNKNFQYVEIQPKLFKSWDRLTDALKSEVIDAAFILSPLAMDLFNHGLPIQTILLGHRDGSALTMNKTLLFHSAQDLKGKNIAVPHTQSTHLVLLRKHLLDADLSFKEVNTPIIPPVEMFGALLTNKIDGFIVAEPFGIMAQAQGIGKMLILTKDILNHHIDCILVVRQHTLTQVSQAIQEWVSSLIRAGQWIEQDKLKQGSQEVARLVAYKYLPHSEKIIVEALQHPQDRISFDDLNPGKEDFQQMMELAIQTEVLNNKVDLNKFVNDVFYLESVNK